MDGSSIFLAVGGSRISNDMDLPMMRQREQRLKMLLSYHYYKKVDLAQLVEDIALPCHIFMDSGAFSAKSLGKPINIKEYMQFLIMTTGKRWRMGLGLPLATTYKISKK